MIIEYYEYEYEYDAKKVTAKATQLHCHVVSCTRLTYRNVKILQINFGFHLHLTDSEGISCAHTYIQTYIYMFANK